MPLTIHNTSLTKNWSNYLEKKGASQVPESLISNFPYSSIGKLFIQESLYAYQFGTGFKIADNIVMTAGHCIGNVISDEGFVTFYKDIVYCPSFPYSNQHYNAVQLVLPSEYINDDHFEFDFGFLIFDEALPGESLQINFEENSRGSCQVIGYPDREKYFGDKMMESKSSYLGGRYLEKFYLFSDLDFTSGISGSPVIDTTTQEVVSLISSRFGHIKNKEMVGPIMRNLMQNYINELLGDFA